MTALMVIGAIAPAMAQFDEERPSKVGLRVVNFIPMDSELRDLKSLWLGPAIDWHLKLDKDNKPISYVTLGMLSSGNGNNKANSIPITYTRVHRKTISPTAARYFAYGAGLDRVRTHFLRVKSSSVSVVEGSAFLPEVHAVYGREFSSAYFAELEMSMLPKWKDMNWGGIYLTVGSRVTF
jgi:hypothetical protein